MKICRKIICKIKRRIPLFTLVFFRHKIPCLINKTRSLKNKSIANKTHFFRPPKFWQYPIHSSHKNIEEFFYKYWNDEISFNTTSATPFIYLPIFWTNYYNAHIENLPCRKLQNFLDIYIDPHKNYFTVVQNDLGIAENVPNNLLTFAAGGIGDIPIPLLCESLPPLKTKRDILASFVGVIDNPNNDKNGIRTTMRDHLQNEENIKIVDAKSNVDLFQEMMSRSTFALCPRGFGKTSFRMYEALNMGAIPVYIYDEPWLPYTEFLDWNEFSVLVHAKDIAKIPKLLRSHTEQDIASKQQKLQELKAKGYFSYKGVCEYIVETIKNKYSNL